MNAKAISEPKKNGCAWIGLFLFGSFFFLIGSAFFWFTFLSPLLQSFAARSWIETECQILTSIVETHADSDGDTYSPEMTYRYRANGAALVGDQYWFVHWNSSHKWAKGIVKEFPVGTRRACYYDPAEPSIAVLNRTMNWKSYLFALFPLLFVGIGLAVMIAGFRTRKSSSENGKRAISGGKSEHLEYSLGSHQDETKHPEDILDQQQAEPKKLKPDTSRLFKFLGLLAVALFWNGIVSVFVYILIFDAPGGWGRIGLGLFLIPFVLVGLFLIAASIHTFMAMFNPAVEVAVSTGAIPLGGEVDIAWQIEGNAGRLQSLKLEIQGSQEATYRRGTSTYTDKDIFSIVVVVETSATSEIEFGSATIVIPADTMHSFSADNNKINWNIVVTGDIRWWPDINETYPVRVKPA